jgi:hypothetical protein
MSRKTVRTPDETRQGSLKPNTLAILVVSLALAVIAGVYAYQNYATGDKTPTKMEAPKP